ncbi:hypothetical protein LJC45_05610 [Alistipes sp. OttesenSCG-928-B03]|nr:hypothetical protein [Alistipes sp. OttesenSCG-928-B03]
MDRQIEYYGKNPGFAWEQAKECMKNQTKYDEMVKEYIIKKAASDPRGGTRAGSTYSEEDVYNVILRPMVEYFKTTFGDEFKWD